MEIDNTEKREISSFDKSISRNILIAKPDKYKLLENITHNNEEIISSGSNLSYSPLSFGKDIISLDLKKFNRIIDFNKSEKTITVEAGITLIEFLNFSLKYNLWIPQLPGYPTITLGGAVATNAHGKSCGSDGTIRNSVKSILLFHKNNGWMTLSENENKEIFDLTIGGLGLTGTIVNVTLALEEIDNTQFITKKTVIKSVEECNEIINNNDNSAYIYSWHRADKLKNFGEGIIFENIINKKPIISFKNLKDNNYRLSPYLFPIWNKLSIKLSNLGYFYLNRFGKKLKKENFLKVIFPFYSNEIYFNFFGKKGFTESQLLITSSKINDFMAEFKKLFKIYRPTITLFSLKKMSGEQSYLRFEDNKICVTFDLIKDNASNSFMNEIDQLCLKYNILPSVIKDSRLPKSIFEKTYKFANVFRENLYKFDKKRVYKSEVSKRLGI